ncbi:MAG: Hpt domain-containing protein [Halobacteriovoraceae bacterium]|nr:Hpt domain-containing protein [Halobacteriovoraceae bacterium]
MPLVKIDRDLEPLMDLFLQKRKEDLDELLKLREKMDFENIRLAGHRIKGASGSYGFSDLGLLGKAIELSAKNKKSEDLINYISKFEEYLNNLEIEFE